MKQREGCNIPETILKYAINQRENQTILLDSKNVILVNEILVCVLNASQGMILAFQVSMNNFIGIQTLVALQGFLFNVFLEIP